MCGIAGILSLDGKPVPRVAEKMTATLVHRGPDDAGVYFGGNVELGMRRLSIIGVSNGRQPLFNEDESVGLVLNGEIYNYLPLRDELRRRGHVFGTDSDAEVAVHLFEDLREGFVDRLRGMFALALYDGTRGELILARDRAGKKPLYYAVTDGCLLFASEIKALHATGLVPKRLNRVALRSYLSYGYVVGPETLFEGVHKLPAGHALRASVDGLQVNRYWDLPIGESISPPPDVAARELRELLEESVKVRLMSEVPLGAFLSGGVDSSAVVALMTKNSTEQVQTFSVGFEDARLDELAHARAAAEHLGTRHHEVLVRGCSPTLLYRINWHNDEPSGDPAAVPTYCLSRFARRRVTVALTGEGGDEMFAGYRHHRLATRLDSLKSVDLPLRLLARGMNRFEKALAAVTSERARKAAWILSLPPNDRMRSWVSAFTDAEIRRLLPAEAGEGAEAIATHLAELRSRVEGLDGLSQLLYIDTKLTLADQLLMKVDKMSMAASLEARCPLLDQNLLEYAHRLPSSAKIAAGSSKVVFRAAVEDLLPDGILARPKQGFDVPLDTWLLRDLRPLVEACLLDPSAAVAAYLDRDAVNAKWVRFTRRSDLRAGFQLWRLLSFAVWHEMHWPTGVLERLGAVTTDPVEVDRQTLSS